VEWLQLFRQSVFWALEGDELSQERAGRVQALANIVECYVDRKFGSALPDVFDDPGLCSECGAGCLDVLTA